MAEFTKGHWWTQRDELRETLMRDSIDEAGLQMEVGEIWSVYSDIGFKNGELGNFICNTGHSADPDVAKEVRANANLIAAAPELYEALESCRVALHRLNGEVSLEVWKSLYAPIKQAQSALAKARGEK